MVPQRDERDLPADMEGAGPGGGADVVHEERAEPRPGSRLALMVTIVLVILVLAVPVLWAAGVYAGLAAPGLTPAATAGYLLLFVMLAAAAILYAWAQLTELR